MNMQTNIQLKSAFKIIENDRSLLYLFKQLSCSLYKYLVVSECEF